MNRDKGCGVKPVITYQNTDAAKSLDMVLKWFKRAYIPNTGGIEGIVHRIPADNNICIKKKVTCKYLIPYGVAWYCKNAYLKIGK